MHITTFEFLFYWLLVLVVYYFLPRRAQNVLLLAASVLFYGTWSWRFVGVLAILTMANFFWARLLRKGQARIPWRLWLGIGGNVGTLVVFKYADFYVPELLQLLGGGATLEWVLKIVLPVGLSYRILENISYLVDVYRGQIPASRNLVDFGLFSFYALKLLSGPIERARSFLNRLAEPRLVDNDVIARSFTLLVIGAFRKLVIADTLAGVIPPLMFESPSAYGSWELVMGLLIYGFMLYNNFAGYTDMMRGLSGFFGLPLSSNFFCPFFSRNMTEIWTRWHTTLGLWLRDYIYLPLSRAFLRRNPNPRRWANVVVPPMAAMLVSGLWHGLSWNLVCWGALIGFFLVISRLPSLWRPLMPPDRQPMWRQLLGMGAVAVAMAFSLVLFIMDFNTAADFYERLFFWTKWVTPPPLAVFGVALSLGLDICQYVRRDEVIFLRWPRWLQAVLLAAALLAIFLATRLKPAEPFIYQGF
ncbi:MAG: MBOAT family protein [Acidobacteria bacterium]|nr:MBOAT family protein [Acidobacteriota bacterium]